MNNKLSPKILSVNWQHYLSRPFNLFETSVWNKWYDSSEIEMLIGVRLNKGFFVEYPKGMVRHYREASNLDAMYKNIRDIAETNLILSEKFLNQGIEWNEKVKKFILEKVELKITEALTFCIQAAFLGTIFPYFAGDILMKKYGEKSLITKKATALRATSYYPKIFSELLIPAAKRELSKQSKISIDLLPYALIDEIQRGSAIEIFEKRKKLSNAGNNFIYFNDGRLGVVIYTKKPSDYLEKIDPNLSDAKTEIKGVIGNKGKITGKAKIVFTNDLSKITFNNGEILVAVSTNPILAPIMKKAVAIVTDEGGSLCHAAIISRELKIPCIIGTKNATKILKDGDLVEVDADKGVVRIIKRY